MADRHGPQTPRRRAWLAFALGAGVAFSTMALLGDAERASVAAAQDPLAGL
jgi:hypothetical protein